MKAFIVTPGAAGSGRIREVPDPVSGPGQALVEVLAVGGCGTDRELLEGKYGEAPPGADYLTIGHESLGRVVSAPGTALRPGELVVAIVRRPDPVPCVNCAAGEWDMCLNGLYTEHGIKGAHGFMAERYAEDPMYLVPLPESLARVGMLLEPLSIVEKGLEQIRRIQTRMAWAPHRALVLGAGTIGTLATLLFRLEGLDVHVYSRGDGGRGREVGEKVGAHFISSDEHELDHQLAKRIGPIDIVVEATGYSPLAFGAMHVVGPNGIVCLTGVSTGSRRLRIDASHLNVEMVLENKLVFGTVNANRRHFESGVMHLCALDGRWPALLDSMITKRVPMEAFNASALQDPGGLKTVIEVSAAGR